MRTLQLNYNYEPMKFISERDAIKLIVKGKAERVSGWPDGFRHGVGYDFVCGANLEFYPQPQIVEYKNDEFKFCSYKCAELFETNPLSYLNPSIIRLKKYAPRHVKRRKYARNGIFKRDLNTCQYCQNRFKASELTVDHVYPKHLGGGKTWDNIVTCCKPCNNKKNDMTPKQAGMKLLRKPKAPVHTVWHEYSIMSEIHEDWQHYIISYK